MNAFWKAAVIIPAMLSTAAAMSVDEAYQSIPHRRTVFSTQEAKMDRAEAESLAGLFQWMTRRSWPSRAFSGSRAGSGLSGHLGR